MFTQRELNLRQRRWLELLKDYDMSVLYHPGKSNVMADVLSRVYMGSVLHVVSVRKSWLVMYIVWLDWGLGCLTLVKVV